MPFVIIYRNPLQISWQQSNLSFDGLQHGKATFKTVIKATRNKSLRVLLEIAEKETCQ